MAVELFTQMDAPGWAKPFFKYGQTEHSRSLAEAGVVMVGTLFDYQNVEKYGSAIGDEYEGRKEVFDTATDLDARDFDRWPRMFREHLAHLKGTDWTYKGTMMLRKPYRHRDVWVYCVSDTLSSAIRDDFKADACVRINNIDGFFAAILDEMARQGLASRMEMHRCHYGPVVQHYSQAEDNPKPGVLKNFHYSHQHEFRALIYPAAGIEASKPELLTVPALTQFCELIPEDYP